jgi:2,4-dienoyl-CoA reductase-like NADH-dependent reductase (Old Yellow Enzyme family)
VGGLVSLPKIEDVLSRGFDFVAIARALVAEPDFIKKVEGNNAHISRCLRCGPCNSCVATMYMGEARCTFEE